MLFTRFLKNIRFAQMHLLLPKLPKKMVTQANQLRVRQPTLFQLLKLKTLSKMTFRRQTVPQLRLRAEEKCCEHCDLVETAKSPARFHLNCIPDRSSGFIWTWTPCAAQLLSTFCVICHLLGSSTSYNFSTCTFLLGERPDLQPFTCVAICCQINCISRCPPILSLLK